MMIAEKFRLVWAAIAALTVAVALAALHDLGPSRSGRLERALNATVQVESVAGSCSGVVVLASGVILSNAHCTNADEKAVDVVLRDGRKLKALVLWRDEAADVLVLSVYAKNLVAAPLRCDLSVAPGDEVWAIGHPGNLSWTVTRGIVSFVGRGVGERWVQVDALIWFGNSGGPLFDQYMRLVGLNNAVQAGRTPIGAQITGHGFALTLKHICQSLKSGGIDLS